MAAGAGGSGGTDPREREPCAFQRHLARTQEPSSGSAGTGKYQGPPPAAPISACRRISAHRCRLPRSSAACVRRRCTCCHALARRAAGSDATHREQRLRAVLGCGTQQLGVWHCGWVCGARRLGVWDVAAA
mmetsp:Transcript_7841/g.23588  ORF Transcript_7841/g.23588 Transcript_7841/m.23588 type:complete len:131 (-) Transcript_7841:3839-4231(-)